MVVQRILETFLLLVSQMSLACGGEISTISFGVFSRENFMEVKPSLKKERTKRPIY